MKLLVLCALVAVEAVAGVALSAAAVQKAVQDHQNVQLLRYDTDNNGLGTYSFAYEQSDGSKRQEEGELRNAGAENEFVAMKGSFSWVGPDGVTYTTNYIADENGYQPINEQGPLG